MYMLHIFIDRQVNDQVILFLPDKMIMLTLTCLPIHNLRTGVTLQSFRGSGQTKRRTYRRR